MQACRFVGFTTSSEPPANIITASPNYIILNASPIAEAPVAQAVEAVPEGPFLF